MRKLLAITLIASLVLVSRAEADERARSSARADTLFAHGKWSEAASEYRDLARQEPASFRSWYRLGFCYTSLSRWDEAIVAYRHAASVPGPPWVADYDLACAYARNERADSALAVLERVVASGYRQPGQIQSDADLQGLRHDPRFAAIVQRADRNARPCAFSPAARQFDFWVGDWEVHDNAHGQALVGSSHVDLLLGDCMIFENWTGVYGGTGKSMNTWNRDCSCWQQIWMDSFGKVVYYTDGHLVNGAMVLVANKAASPKGAGLQRLSFFHLGSNQVRQLAETSADGGQTWRTTYDFNYIRKKPAEVSGPASASSGTR
jgi:tetratricopeptide repeat protein